MSKQFIKKISQLPEVELDQDEIDRVLTMLKGNKPYSKTLRTRESLGLQSGDADKPNNVRGGLAMMMEAVRMALSERLQGSKLEDIQLAIPDLSQTPVGPSAFSVTPFNPKHVNYQYPTDPARVFFELGGALDTNRLISVGMGGAVNSRAFPDKGAIEGPDFIRKIVVPSNVKISQFWPELLAVHVNSAKAMKGIRDHGRKK